jgi:hypothetical protein
MILLQAIILTLIGFGVIFLVMRLLSMKKLHRHYMSATTTPPELGYSIDSAKAEEGLRYLKGKKLILCGMMRDSMRSLPTLRSNLEKLSQVFGEVKMLVVENDSRDGTRAALLKLANEDQRVTVLGCGVNARSCKLKLAKTEGHAHEGGRIQKMIRLRNIYLDYIERNPDRFDDADFVAIMDMDLVGTFYLDGLGLVGHALKQDDEKKEISALCTNGVRVTNLGLANLHFYADPYAHTEKGDLEIASPLWSEHDEKTLDLRKVDSCFGGLVFYRKDDLEGLRYKYERDAVAGGEPKCEHRTLHSQLGGVWFHPKALLVILQN